MNELQARREAMAARAAAIEAEWAAVRAAEDVWAAELAIATAADSAAFYARLGGAQ